MANKLEKRSPGDIIGLKPYLDEWVTKVEQPEYINGDPVQFMHAFEDKEDQTLAGFFAAIMAWGRRDIVINKVDDFLNRMNYRPAEFIGNFSETDAKRFDGFKHRTFKPIDMYWLTRILSSILQTYGTFEAFWNHCYLIARRDDRELMAVFHNAFFNTHPETPRRSRKHISDAGKNSSCKRLYLYLKWCIRKNSVVDPGIMNFMPPSELIVPLDVHVARQARRLGLMSRNNNDWKAALELTQSMRLLDADDPAKYDYALFGLGISEEDIPDKYLVNA